MTGTDEDHYYATGYDVDNDPYVYDNGVLVNHFSITNTSQLNEVEAQFSALSIEQLLKQHLPSVFDTAYHCHLHREIFTDIYPWAGEIRKVDICKGSTTFQRNKAIQEDLDQLFAELLVHNNYRDCNAEQFSHQAGNLLNRLNFIHPFREGNGRTQRLLLTQIAHQAGFSILWSSISADAMKNACIVGHGGEQRAMQRLLFLNLEPVVAPAPPVKKTRKFK